MAQIIRVRQHLRRGFPVRSHSRKIKIPPAWKNVKHFTNRPYVATGVDSKGRLQYVYPKHVLEQGANRKYKRIERLAGRKEEILGEIIQDAKDGRVEAQAVYTMYKTGFRPGSEKDTKSDVRAYGATTLLRRQVKVKPKNKVEFDFIGKKGVRVKKEVQDRLLSKIMKERRKDEHVFDTSDAEVREYWNNRTRGQFQLKDLRTLKAFETADKILKSTAAKSPIEIKKEVIQAVSKELGNTPAIAASSYIAPKIAELKKKN